MNSFDMGSERSIVISLVDVGGLSGWGGVHVRSMLELGLELGFVASLSKSAPESAPLFVAGVGERLTPR
jgi:hypothetical protein